MFIFGLFRFYLFLLYILGHETKILKKETQNIGKMYFRNIVQSVLQCLKITMINFLKYGKIFTARTHQGSEISDFFSKVSSDTVSESELYIFICEQQLKTTK